MSINARQADEHAIRTYYDYIWSVPIKLDDRNENPLLGFHYGLYTKGIKNSREAAINMNDFIGTLFDFSGSKTMHVFDAGCGIGSTSMYLALKYPFHEFTGLSLSSAEIAFAQQTKYKKNINNVTFYVGSYLKTDFQSNFFEGVFALESFCYSHEKKKFVSEMKRILKPDGKLVIIDGFRTNVKLGSFMKIVDKSFLSRRMVPDLMTIQDIKKLLTEQGFTDITVTNLSNNTALIYNFFQPDFFKIWFYFIVDQFQRIFKGKRYKQQITMEYIFGALIPEMLLGFNKNIQYCVITAIKNHQETI